MSKVDLQKHGEDEEITNTYRTNLGLTVVRLGTEGTKLPLQQERTRPSFVLK